ncbi:MAG TPA: polysaccharide biosynthesis/export family protein [Xanthobacteraceae bacterium]|jgi:polysaccharide export outer membrane protein|nr:polysaccharide biosynthesis/export family protein [Xanthobacteraceae bacterium]
MRVGMKWLAFISFILGMLFPAAASAEYVLAPGDVLEISAVGLRDLRQTATINLDGQAALPLIGPIKAAGLTLPEAREKIKELLPAKVFRRRNEDGRESTVVLSPDEISVTIAEYRPVYLDGDVAKPGALPFRAGLSVRQAISLAGGYDAMHFRGRDPFLESADFRAEYYSLWTNFAKEQALIARLKAELADQATLNREEFIETPITSSTSRQIEQIETQTLHARTDDFKKEMVHLNIALKQQDRRIAALTESQQKEQEGAQADAADLEDMRANFKKGVIPVMRMTEARRLTLFSATQSLQTTALLSQVEKEREETARSLQRVIDERRIKLLGELQEAEVRIETIRSRLQGVGDKLLYTGLVKSQLIRGEGRKPDLQIHRDANGQHMTFAVDEDTQLMPGDVVDVALRIEQLAATSLSR